MEESNVYDLVVRCEIDGEEENFLFDYVEDATTNLTSDITTHKCSVQFGYTFG